MTFLATFISRSQTNCILLDFTSQPTCLSDTGRVQLHLLSEDRLVAAWTECCARMYAGSVQHHITASVRRSRVPLLLAIIRRSLDSLRDVSHASKLPWPADVV